VVWCGVVLQEKKGLLRKILCMKEGNGRKSPHGQMRLAKRPTTTHQYTINFIYSFFDLICFSCFCPSLQFPQNLLNVMEHEQETNFFISLLLCNHFLISNPLLSLWDFFLKSCSDFIPSNYRFLFNILKSS